jgi:hypothetical protein
MAVVKDCAVRYRKLITARIAVVLVALRDCRNAFAFAARTRNAVRPAQSRKDVLCIFRHCRNIRIKLTKFTSDLPMVFSWFSYA